MLAEAIVALGLGLLVLGAFVGAATGSLRWIARLWEEAETVDLVHTVWAVLDEELRPGVPGRDWELHESGKWVSLRAFRGIARVCGPAAEDDTWAVAVRGRREAEVGRDSVLVLGRDGGWRAFALESVERGGACLPRIDEVAERWGWAQGSTAPPVLVRFFERGEYHLADGALRYRRGGGGRQPLTPERISDESGFEAISGGLEVVVRLLSRTGGAPAAFRWTVQGADGPRTEVSPP